ncbi:hypothetical protein OC861_006939, partial [Tilletia horrida]
MSCQSGVDRLRSGEVTPQISPLRARARGKISYSLPLFAFLDDVSGSTSKKWDEHHVCHIQCAALDSTYVGVDATIHVFTATKKATVSEITAALAAELIRVQLELFPLLKRSLVRQMNGAASGSVKAWREVKTSSGVRDSLTDAVCKRLLEELKERVTPEDGDRTEALEELRQVQNDIIADDKFWNPLFSLHDARQLQGDYLVQYYNSLVGKEIKQLFQVMPWALEQMGALMKLRRAWHTQGALAAALHAPVLIRSAASEWRNFLNKLLKQFYMDMAKVVPTALSSKSKMHTITHAVEDVSRFGPLPLVSAERFESLNAVVRQASMLSNRKNPSRDIVTRLCDQELIRNVIAGTPYRKVGEATMFDTGTELRNFITSSREVQDTMHKFYGATPLHQPRAPLARGDPEGGQTQGGDTFKTGDIVMLRHELPADAQ